MTEITSIEQGSVRGFLHRPAEANGDGLVLTHGAGGNCQAALLVAAAGAFAEAGWSVLRCDLPFRQRKRFGPPTPAGAADDRRALKEAAAVLRSILPGRICLGGHSYGGRQASMLVAEDPHVAGSLLLFSYPLHPPKKPQDARTGHFPRLQTPAMFVHGTNDPFGSVEEIRTALAMIPAVTELVTIQKAGHDLLKGSFNIVQLVIEPFQRMIVAATGGLVRPRVIPP
ncbi:MAG: alpha/beta family hydrolase [Bryobacteraceae bacterium]